MTERGPLDAAFVHALATLSSPRPVIPGDRAAVTTVPGLYALHATETGLADLGLNQHPAGRPIYVGKSQSSLRTRTLGTHFRTGRTGHSTVRRSLAALLQENLDLTVVQRPGKGHPTNFSITAPGDARLTEWMFIHLRLACWACSEGLHLPVFETAVIRHWCPPMNLDHAGIVWPLLVERLADMRRQMPQHHGSS